MSTLTLAPARTQAAPTERGPHAVVIGSGFGGLAAAVSRLAQEVAQEVVQEAAP